MRRFCGCARRLKVERAREAHLYQTRSVNLYSREMNLKVVYYATALVALHLPKPARSFIHNKWHARVIPMIDVQKGLVRVDDRVLLRVGRVARVEEGRDGRWQRDAIPLDHDLIVRRLCARSRRELSIDLRLLLPLHPHFHQIMSETIGIQRHSRSLQSADQCTSHSDNRQAVQCYCRRERTNSALQGPPAVTTRRR